ncbi:MAG: rhamnulokinase family protein [Oscillospiraceae bacterium]
MLYYLAVDIGASSGRHILCEKQDGKIVLEEIYRFENGSIEKNGHSVWDMEGLFSSVVAGIKKCGELGKFPKSMAIDTWGVDFLLLDADGKPLGDSVAYRDERTLGMDILVEKKVPFSELYTRTGIQKQPYNTIYQLEAIQNEGEELLEKADALLMVPSYLSYLLTGKKCAEYTQATTSALVNARKKDWDDELMNALGFRREIFGKLYMPGETVGPLKEEIAREVGFSLEVLLCASHDTASAFMAVPALDQDAVYLSSGTWSLLGVENQTPITNSRSLCANFSNEGGYDYRFRYLKNIMGLWMIQSVRRNLDKKYSFAQLEAMAREECGFAGRVDVNDNRFLAPKSMVDEVTKAASQRPENLGQLMECIYRSLADCYAAAIKELEALTGKTFTSVNIVGGGSRDSYLNALTAESTGLPVWAGPTEGTAIGNLLAQMIRYGEFADLAQAREAIRNSFEIVKYEP